ncbi:MAG: thrombospondin type 3 repeat-containing protein [Acidobacteriota bacterium]
MIDLPTLVVSLLSMLDPTAADAAGNESHLQPASLQAPPGVELAARPNIRIPWELETRAFADGPYVVEMMDVVAQADDEKDSAPFKAKKKNRIPGMLPPELTAIQRLEALLLPPSDRVQVLSERPTQKSVTSSTSNVAIDASSSNSVPPDPELAVGPSHVIAVVNTSYRIFSAATGTPLISATRLTNLMGGNSTCDSGLFDPNVLYDEEYDRFLIGADANGSDYCLAVSLTSNPLGQWAIYSIATDIGGFFFDYPHAGVGLEAIYIGSNQFFDDDNDGDLDYQESRIFAIERLPLYLLQAPSVTSWSLAGQGSSFTPQPVNLHGFSDGTWPTSGPHYVITDQFDSRDVNVWTIDDPFGAGTLTRQSKLDIETYTGVAAAQVVDPPQIVGDDLDAGDFRVLDFEYRNGFGWTVQNVSCNPGSGTVNCVRWAQIDLAGNSIADAGVFSINSRYTLHPDLAVNRCNDMLVGFSVSGSTTHPSAWVAGRESDDPAGTLSFSQVQVQGIFPYSAFDGEPLRWGDYTGATVGPDGASLWYLGQWSSLILNEPSNWSTHFTRYDYPDSDNDGYPNSCDACSGSDDSQDADDDTVPDGCDQCAGSDDRLDTDDDGIPNGCDLCEGDDASGNSDGDAYCNNVDICSLGDDDIDSDFDGVPDACDACQGDDATGNSDGDAYCNDVDVCALGDDDIDSDFDGVPDACDACQGDDATGNSDGDAYCDDIDVCALGDDDVDSDADGTADACDVCFGSDNVDADGDGVCDSLDLCFGDDATGDGDGDMRCADLDCNDNNGSVQDADRCGVCEGDGTACVVLFPIGDVFQVTSTYLGDQTAPSVAAGDDGFLVTWTSDDGDGDGIRGRRFAKDGTAGGNDFAINATTSGSQAASSASAVGAGDFVVAWQSDNVDGDRTGIAGRLVDDGAVGSELLLNSDATNGQRSPSVAPRTTGFQAVWEGFDAATADTGVMERRYLTDGSGVAADQGLTGAGIQTTPDVAEMPSGALVTWIDDSSGVRAQLLGSDGVPAAQVQADASGQSAAVAADDTGRALVAWADADGDGSGNAGVFARRLAADGSLAGDRIRVSPSASGDQEAPDVTALPGGGFLVVYEDQQFTDLRAQLYEADGSVGIGGVSGALVGESPFLVNEDTSATATAPAVAVDGDGTFFVVWSDSKVDGSGAGIAGRLFGTDVDADNLAGAVDNCPLVANADQADADNDQVGDPCDQCAGSDDRIDADSDGTPDGCDTCTDTDSDGAGDPGFADNTCTTDNCPDDPNADQADADSDGTGDVCDTCTDTAGDGAGDPGFADNTCTTDNCPNDANADQADADLDGTGDVCDTCTDTDNDGAGDPGYPANTCSTDNCPDIANVDQADADSDGAGDVCDTCTDTDNDGAGDPGFAANTCNTDNCPDDANADQADEDQDGLGDACDLCLGDNGTGDGDGDGVCADRDCDDGDGNAQSVDGCGVCGGDNACAIFTDDFETGDTSSWAATVML